MMALFCIEVDCRPVERVFKTIECKAEELTHGRVFGETDPTVKDRIIKKNQTVYPYLGRGSVTYPGFQLITEIKEI